MPALLCRLVKITAQKKLMVRVTEQTYDIVAERANNAAMKQFGKNLKSPAFSLDNDDGVTSHFCMINLDKYDKQLLERKFEPMIRKDIAIDYQIKTYDFDKDGENHQGVNVLLLNLRKYTGKKPLFEELGRQYQKLDDEDVDAIAEAAEKRVLSQTAELNAEETAIDADVGKPRSDFPAAHAAVVQTSIAECLAMEAEAEEAYAAAINIPAPPKLQRQHAITEAEAQAMSRRRQFVPTGRMV